MKNTFLKNSILWVLVLFAIVAGFGFIANQGANVTQLTYNEYRDKLLKREFTDINVQTQNGTYLITGKYVKDKDKSFVTNGPMDMGSTVVQDIQKVGSKVTYEKMKGESIWLNLLTSLVIPLVVLSVLFFFMLNQAQGGGSRVMNFGKSKARLYNEEKKKITFDDVAGSDTEKVELAEIVDFLKDSTRYVELGARIPKGVLLVGPPGTGKTLLARAVAGEAQVPFLSISGSDFVEMFVGVGASRVRDLFSQAKESSPCIIFIDEIDAVGRQRGTGLGGGHDEREQTLNQLLVEMDGFDVNSGIIIMAATNRADVLDPAILRPGRFDRQIYVTAPDIKGREEILKLHANNKPLADEVSLKAIAGRTTGFSGADLENMLNEAAILAARNGKTKIGTPEIDEAIDRVIMGPQKTTKVSSKERNIVAFHEAGHVVVGYKLQDADMVHKVTIVPRGNAAGYAMMLPKEDRYISTKQELLDRITGLLGGRVAEEIVFGEVSTGASNDFEKATAIARAMVTEYGMSDKLATMLFGRSNGQVFLGRDFGSEQSYSDRVAYEIDQEMQDIIKNCYDKAKTIVSENRGSLDLLAKTLLERETLVAEEIEQLMETGSLPALDEVKVNIQKKSNDRSEEEESKDSKD